MAKARTQKQIVVERFIPADIEETWRMITDPDDSRRYYDDNVVESSWMPGEPLKYCNDAGEVVIEGVVVDVDPPHRLEYTFRHLSQIDEPGTSSESSIVVWTLEPSDDGTHVVLTHRGLDALSVARKETEDSWEQVLDSMLDLANDEQSGSEESF